MCSQEGSKMDGSLLPEIAPETRETGMNQINTGNKVGLQWQFMMGHWAKGRSGKTAGSEI